MKSLLSMTILGIMSFFSNEGINNNITLDEINLNMVNHQYEMELESVDIEMENNFYLQKDDCNGVDKYTEVELADIDLYIPNYKYIEELESVEYNL